MIVSSQASNDLPVSVNTSLNSRLCLTRISGNWCQLLAVDSNLLAQLHAGTRHSSFKNKYLPKNDIQESFLLSLIIPNQLDQWDLVNDSREWCWALLSASDRSNLLLLGVKYEMKNLATDPNTPWRLNLRIFVKFSIRRSGSKIAVVGCETEMFEAFNKIDQAAAHYNQCHH